MKAMILAAGRGMRMRPLTDSIPKPLLKVGQRSLIEHNILKLAKAGVTDIVINIAYRGDQIKAQLGDGKRYQVNIIYSDEQDKALGPGGGIVNALPLLGTQHFILMGADLFSDFPIESLFTCTQHLAHMVMIENPDFHPQGDYAISDDGFLASEGEHLTYAGYSVWHPDVFKQHPVQYYELTPFIKETMQQYSLTAEKFSGQWLNIGTPKQLESAQSYI